MKVLLIHPRLARSGGLENRLLNYTHYFLSKGCEVHIACRRADKNLIKPGMVIHKFAPLLPGKHSKNFIFNQKLEKWKKPVFDFELSLGRTTVQKNILAPATHQGFIRGLNKTTLTASDELYISMDQQGYNTSQHIFAASNKVKNEIIEFYGIPEKKIEVLYPPFNTQNHQQYTEDEIYAIRDEFKLKANKTYYLFVSNSHDLKGLNILMAVFEQLKNSPHTLLVIGKPFRSTLSNVISMGYFVNMSKAYALGDYLLHPSYYDAFAQVVTEALYHGLPVVVSPNTGAKEIITPQLGILAGDFNPDTWVEIILSLKNQPFQIPRNLITNLQLDLPSHIHKMLSVNGISLI
jgi:glycosyltransferase involved in cell wall biosynthesis